MNKILDWLRNLGSKPAASPVAKKLSYSGTKARPHLPRPVRYLHVSAPIVQRPVVDKDGKVVGIERVAQKPGHTYYIGQNEKKRERAAKG